MIVTGVPTDGGSQDQKSVQASSAEAAQHATGAGRLQTTAGASESREETLLVSCEWQSEKHDHIPAVLAQLTQGSMQRWVPQPALQPEPQELGLKPSPAEQNAPWRTNLHSQQCTLEQTHRHKKHKT